MSITENDAPKNERRRPTFSQRYSVAVDTAMIIAMISAILWVGQKTKTIDTVDETMKVQVSKLNTIDKEEEGRMVRDTTNRRLYMARGPAPTDPWDLCDGSASVTPA